MIYHDLTHEQYRALPGWNWSTIKVLEDQSPLAVAHYKTRPDKDTPSRIMLRAIHCLTFEPQNFSRDFSTFSGKRDKRSAAFQEHQEQHPNTSVLSPTDERQAKVTADTIRMHPLVYPVLKRGMKRGMAEVSFTWNDAATGLPCKGRADWIMGDNVALYDLKTWGTVNEREVGRMATKQATYGQMAHYVDGLAANGIDVPAYLIVAEGKLAHDVAVFEVDSGIPDGSLTAGRKLRAKLLERIAECTELNHWPGRHEEVQTLDLPAYVLEDNSDDITFGDSE